MELKQIKYINNLGSDLPKFDGGYTPFDWNYTNNAPGWNEWSQPLNQPSNPPAMQTAIGNLSDYDPDVLKQAVTGTSGPGSYNSVFGNIPSNDPKPKGKGITGGQAASVIGGVADLAGGVIGQLNSVKSEHEMMAHAGTVQGNIGGIGYEKQNYIDEGAEKSALDGSGLSNTIGGVAKGASAGAAFGPWGAAIGGVIGGLTGIFSWGASQRKLHKRLENARQLTRRTNTGAQAGAMTTALQQDYYKNNGNLGGVLYT